MKILENNSNIEQIFITEHAFKRAKERMQWKSASLEKMAHKAYKNGISHSETKGSLNKYITKLWFEHKKAGNIRIYGEVIYFFDKNILITLYRLPHNMIKRVKYTN